MINISKEHKEKMRQEVLELISENNKNEITLEQLKLFIALFFDMNKEKIIFEENQDDNKEQKIKEIKNIEELLGLDKLWNIVFQISDEKILSFGINILYQIYQNDNLDKLLEKCNSFINQEKNEEKADNKLIEKYITLMKLIIIESEKNILFTPKSHLSLIKNCLINLPIEIASDKNLKSNEDKDKITLLGNTNFNNMKIIVSNLYGIPPKRVLFSFSKKFSKFLKKNSKEKETSEIKIDEEYNNISLYETIIQNEESINSNLFPKDKIIFSSKKPEEEKLLIDGEMNPKLTKLLKSWYYEFTQGTMQMDRQGVIRFIYGVSPRKNPINSTDSRITNFLKLDKDRKGYVSEEEFLLFFDKAVKDPLKRKNVWSNINNMGYGNDLKREGENNGEIFNFYMKEKLPRYKLGNDLNLIENLVKKYYEKPNEYFNLNEFLNYLTTNEIVYNDILNNLFNDDNTNENNNFILKAFKDKNKYIELNYLFIIIESILQDLEIYLYNSKYKDSNDNIVLGYGSYKILSLAYEPFDNEENIDKKINFVKKIIKTENFQILINHINDLLENLLKLIKEKQSPNIISLLYDFCLRGIKLLNILNNFSTINNEKEILKQNMKQNCVYYLGKINLKQLFEGEDFTKEFDNLSYKKII